APRLDRIRLPELSDADVDAFESHTAYDALRISGADLDGLDLSGTTFAECAFEDVSAHEADLRSATFLDTTIERLNAPILTAARSRLRDVGIDSSRIGSAEFYDAGWQSVRFTNCKLGFVNLRGAHLQDVQFTDCTIDELDLGGVKATRVAFSGTRINTLDVTRAEFSHVDLRAVELRHIVGLDGLRGATLTPDQVAELATLFAERLGITVES
ncbi:MAG: pentapeptide repeat-containing protein, partial [Leifsonia sp.]